MDTSLRSQHFAANVRLSLPVGNTTWLRKTKVLYFVYLLIGYGTRLVYIPRGDKSVDKSDNNKAALSAPRTSWRGVGWGETGERRVMARMIAS